jgi:hypothetical protein
MAFLDSLLSGLASGGVSFAGDLISMGAKELFGGGQSGADSVASSLNAVQGATPGMNLAGFVNQAGQVGQGAALDSRRALDLAGQMDATTKRLFDSLINKASGMGSLSDTMGMSAIKQGNRQISNTVNQTLNQNRSMGGSPSVMASLLSKIGEGGMRGVGDVYSQSLSNQLGAKAKSADILGSASGVREQGLARRFGTEIAPHLATPTNTGAQLFGTAAPVTQQGADNALVPGNIFGGARDVLGGYSAGALGEHFKGLFGNNQPKPRKPGSLSGAGAGATKY